MEDKRPHWFYYILFSFHFAWQKFSHPRGTESRKMNGNDEVHSCEGQSNAYSIYLSMYNAATSWSSRAGVWPSLGQWKGLERVVFCEQAWLAFSLWKWREKASIEDSSKSTTTGGVQLTLLHYNRNGAWFRYIFSIGTHQKRTVFAASFLWNFPKCIGIFVKNFWI